MNNQIQGNNNQAQQGNQGQQQGGFGFFKIILTFIGINYMMSLFQSNSRVDTYFNILNSNSLFNLTITNNVTDWTLSELDLIYSKDTMIIKNITLTGEELLQNPYFKISLGNSNFNIQSSFSLTKLMKVQQNEKKNLLFDKHDEYMIKKADENQTDSKYEWHVKNKQYLLFVHDSNSYPKNQIPPQIKYRFQRTEEGFIYTPNLDVDNYFLRKKDHILIKTNETYEIPIEFSCYYSWKYYMIDSLKNAGKFYENLGMDIYDEIAEDNTKEMLFETNFYLVAVTMIVSLLHTIFSTLAIKNDFQYWKNLNSQEGISIRALYTNFVFDIIITLYLLDNETSYLIIVQQFVELGLMVWKITKTTKFKIINVFPYVEFLHQKSYESKTQQYDQKAANFLYKLSIPLFGGYLIYALIYQEHKGIYSFIIESLVEFIYLFGFINMTPQLFINYKLKSVAHLPWRTMIYKFLNTIIDDLFAFIITMPWLKRLSCFRDDIIFLIYIYQRRIYKVDPNRLDAGYSQDIDAKQEVTDGKEKKD
ncbi:unnamed protein product [Paramecium primaurelia]|uniref:Uncharacterized protein n=1 Tax=Paramecium primaurelia TaxID=5886 RepID=A0A8S1K0G3_PARPR|nr:unnamed protein product [Paramecium primaurelia]